jgi:hypothetical protein
MIISHQHKFMFFAIPKTGTHSVRFALREHMNEKDLEQVGLFKQSKLPFKKLADLHHGHLTYQEIDAYFKPLTDQYYKFAFVRNPYDRIISYYFFTKQPKDLAPALHKEEIKKILTKENIESRILMRPQWEFLCDNNGKIKMDFIGKVENFKADLRSVFTHLKLGEPQYHEINKSSHLPYTEYLDDELKQMIQQHYKNDFELFAY